LPSEGLAESASKVSAPEAVEYLAAVEVSFLFTKWGQCDVPALFAEHYTADTRGVLPFMHLDGPEPIPRMLTAAGFVGVAAERRHDLSLDGGIPYLITATRP
jgi:hypothetical protein